ncbi:MAG TPA: UdgX family uracil-DNA binding protein [Polaromonas sp.]|uniref:UdgX family uracil-DNA binding protein n=1 Tax=Polaromonas sp. TaxID=1869339 RepID=UPI002D54CE06|nr:UdgX family uracil-DNA binding protein [Polaromonas sp.]HYW55528.1 UdgX family uracil-DNA binding protein [Polaromonas sp.]
MGVMNDLLTDDLFPQALLPITLQSPTDLEGFRRASRALLAQQMLPEQVSWHTVDAPTQDLFATDEANTLVVVPNIVFSDAPPVNVPPEYLALAETAILHSDPNRFGLLYRILWRLQHEPDLRHDALDADMVQAQHLAQAVRRDMHKMKAFVRFRTVQDETFRNHIEGGPLHVAWFEPDHHIVEAIAPFFKRRFTQMRWAILTPERSVEWDGATLRFGPGAQKSDAPPADAGEKLWLTYYQHIFNPARLKLKMMQKEMPRRYWKNLPEAELISGLSAASAEQHITMIEQPATTPRRRIPIFRAGAAAVSRQQGALALNNPGHHPLTLPALNAAAQRCRECPIGEHATQAVCGEGPANARVMIVGEQPGDQEDLRGRPFVGPAGQLFDRALHDLGWQRSALYITNAVKHFKFEPRGPRRMHKTPSQHEAAACLHWLESEISLVHPDAVIALGATAAASLLGRHVAVMSERGQWFTREDGLRVLVTLHPAALLRTEADPGGTAYAHWLQDLRQADDLMTPRMATTKAPGKGDKTGKTKAPPRTAQRRSLLI